MAYMSGITFYRTVKEAEEDFLKLENKNRMVLEKHKDGSGAIVRLSDYPYYKNQPEYVR